MGEREREREAVYDGWWRCETLADVEEHERLMDGYAVRSTSGSVRST